MGAGCMALPILPGKVHDFTKQAVDHVHDNLAEYEESRRRAGVRRERVYHMTMPDGDFAVFYLEAERPLLEVRKSFLISDLGIDRFLVGQWSELFGIDLRKGMGPSPELVWNYVDGSASRTKGIAFAVPVPERKTEALVAFLRNALSRFAELQKSRRALKLTREQAWLEHSPKGDFLCVYLEGQNPVMANERFAASNDPYDVWFKEKLGEILGMDFNQPLPLITTLWDWSADEGLAG